MEDKLYQKFFDLGLDAFQQGCNIDDPEDLPKNLGDKALDAFLDGWQEAAEQANE